MLQADKNEALKKALFHGDVSLIEELLNSGEESQLRSLIFLIELGEDSKASKFLFQNNVLSACRNMNMFSIQDINSYFKDEITFSVTQYVVLQEIPSNFYFLRQAGALKIVKCVSYQIRCFFVFRCIFNLKISITNNEFEVV